MVPWTGTLVIELEKCTIGIGRYIQLVLLLHNGLCIMIQATHTHFEQVSLCVPLCPDAEFKLQEHATPFHFPPRLCITTGILPHTCAFLLQHQKHNLTCRSLPCFVCKMLGFALQVESESNKRGGNALKPVRLSTVVRCNQYMITYYILCFMVT